MKTKALLLLMCLTFLACGGGGGGGGTSNPLAARYMALMSSVNQEDVSATMGHYHSTYCNQGANWTEVRDGWITVFSTPNYSLRLSNLNVTLSSIDSPNGQGYIEGTVHVKETDNGVVTEGDLNLAMWFIRDGSTWYLLGDGVCFADSSPEKLKAVLGLD